MAVAAGPVPIRVAVAGSGGRMGQALIDAVFAAGDLTLTGALEISGSPLLGRDVGERSGRATGVKIIADISAGIRNADVLVDFTRPEGTLANLAACAAAKVGIRALYVTSAHDNSIAVAVSSRSPGSRCGR